MSAQSKRKPNLSGWLAALCVALLATIDSHAELIDGEELKDPTRPAGAVINPAGESGSGLLAGLLGDASELLGRGYTVSFIRAGGTDPVAMINDQLVRTGDRLGEAEVVSIDRDSVSLRIDGEIRQVLSFDSSVKSRTRADAQ